MNLETKAMATDKLQLILDLSTTLSLNVRVRDRFVKTIQYSCQMLLGFYGSQFSKQLVEALKLTRRSSSTARKAFWLLKSVNHVKSLYGMLQNYSYKKDAMYIQLMEIIEQIALIFYFYYENLIFLARNRIVSFTEDDVDAHCNWSWFIGDLACFLAAFFTLLTDCKDFYKNYCNFIDIKRSLKLMGNIDHRIVSPVAVDCLDQIEEDDLELVAYNKSFSVDSSYDLYKATHDTIYKNFMNHSLSLSIASLELIVSADYVNIWKKLFGNNLGDGGVGFCGATAASLCILEIFMKELKDYKQKS